MMVRDVGWLGWQTVSMMWMEGLDSRFRGNDGGGGGNDGEGGRGSRWRGIGFLRQS